MPVVATRIFEPFPANRQGALNEDQRFFHFGIGPLVVGRLIDERLPLFEGHIVRRHHNHFRLALYGTIVWHS